MGPMKSSEPTDISIAPRGSPSKSELRSCSWLIPMLIAAAVLFGHSPVLFSDYLRQDDWSAATWNLVIQDHVDLRAHMLDEFRPLSVPFLF